MLGDSNQLGLYSETFFQKIRTGGILAWLKHLSHVYKTLSSIPRATGDRWYKHRNRSRLWWRIRVIKLTGLRDA